MAGLNVVPFSVASVFSAAVIVRVNGPGWIRTYAGFRQRTHSLSSQIGGH